MLYNSVLEGPIRIKSHPHAALHLLDQILQPTSLSPIPNVQLPSEIITENIAKIVITLPLSTQNSLDLPTSWVRVPSISD